MSVLSHRIYGNSGKVIYILHGIFGMKDNWHLVAGKLSNEYTVITADARNHGHSFHDFEMSYKLMADDAAGLMQHLGHTNPILIGHSMGGKTAMTLASLYPELLSKLIVVDIGLRAYRPGHLPYFNAFETIDFTEIQSRTEADEAFFPYAKELSVRQFLLKNLEPLPGGGYKPRFNLPAIKKFYTESIGALQLPMPACLKPSLLVYGNKSDYVGEADKLGFSKSFPASAFAEIPGAGHWVHADNPEGFITAVKQFIED